MKCIADRERGFPLKYDGKLRIVVLLCRLQFEMGRILVKAGMFSEVGRW